MRRSAVESGPPETAISVAFAARERREQRVDPRVGERLGAARRSTVVLRHFAIGEALHRRRRGRVALAEFGEGGAGLILVAERGERLAEPHHAFGRAVRFGE